MDNNVIEMKRDTLFYIPDDEDGKKMKGVGDSGGMIEFINVDKDWVGVYSEGDGTIEKIKFKHLCIAWLALNYPDALKFDDN